jgi:hypothetical protein
MLWGRNRWIDFQVQDDLNYGERQQEAGEATRLHNEFLPYNTGGRTNLTESSRSAHT